MRSALHLVPRTRSSRRPSGKCDRELRVQRGTRIIELLVVLRFRSSHLNVPRVLANFGIGPLVAIALGFPNAAQALDTITAGAVGSASTTIWPVYIGIRQGFFAEAGLKVEPVFAQSSTAIAQQVAAGSVNMTVGSGLVDPIRA